ncbi:MAG: recombinase family protein [Elusimicrobia bacterium]|nr:recombinase family protein [Elusimicrobiota bacterium]
MRQVMEPTNKAVIYARVSTREQAEQGYSVESQIKLLRDYSQNHGLEIVREFTDVESAKASGRMQFSEMLRFLKTNTTTRTVVCEKTDRLYRNFHDYIDLDVDKSGLTVILVKENTTLNKDSRSHEKLVHGFKVLLAKNYIDNLKEETAKGMLEKAEQGEFPQHAPFGYKNNKETHLIELDQRAPLIRKMFEFYATGNYSLKTLEGKIYEEGLRSKSGRKIYKSELAYILGNPIYYGYFIWRRKLYKGIHEPIVSKELFDMVQKVLKRFDKPRITKKEYAFRGLLTCGVCGCAYTAEKKKGKYVYYHCTFAKGRCKNSYLREEALDQKLEEILKTIQIDQGVLEFLTGGLKESHSQEKAYHDQAIATLHQTYRKLQEKLDKAYNDKLDGVIPVEFWEKQSALWRKEQEDARIAVAQHEHANQRYFELGLELLELAHEAHSMYQVRSLPQKRQLLNFVVSNLKVEGENLIPSYKKPFDLLAQGRNRTNWLPD